ncbi:MAG TPA: DUF2782 domain-containing protein [Gammaproteobacteria bacterium]|jgi:hypothetical protein
MPSKIITLLGLISLLTCSSLQAQRPQNLQPVPEPPPPPQRVNDGEAIPMGEPQITIIRRGEAIIREYRLNGHLYAVKITPERGVPYYLIDADGDGYMEGQFKDVNNSRIIVPQWVLYRW